MSSFYLPKIKINSDNCSFSVDKNNSILNSSTQNNSFLFNSRINASILTNTKQKNSIKNNFGLDQNDNLQKKIMKQIEEMLTSLKVFFN